MMLKGESLHSCSCLFSSEYCAVHDWVTGAGRDSYSIRRVIRDCGGGTIDPAADPVCREGVDSAAAVKEWTQRLT